MLASLLALFACGSDAGEVVAYTSVDQVFAEPVFRDFERRTGIRVRAVYDTEEAKSTGVLARLLAEGDHPQADVFWSGDPVRPFALAKRRLLARYVPKGADAIPAGFRAADGTWTGVAARARVLLVNRRLVPEADTPRGIGDLAAPRWKGKTAIASPLFGTTTMHVAALFAAWGDARARAWLDALRANDVRVAASNGDVKRLVVSGEVAFGLVDTDDAKEAVDSGASVAVVYPDEAGVGTLVMPTSVVLLRGAPHPAEARRLADDLVSPRVERRLAASAHMPLHAGVPTPIGVRTVSAIHPMRVDYARVAETMERIEPWLRDWVGL
jgi:iron(III) transport system substrate-binding protein